MAWGRERQVVRGDIRADCSPDCISRPANRTSTVPLQGLWDPVDGPDTQLRYLCTLR
jgi:hypothetical protein